MDYRPTYKLHFNVAGSYQYSEFVNESHLNTLVYFSPELLLYFKSYYEINDHITVGVKANYVSDMISEVDFHTLQSVADDVPEFFTFDMNVRLRDILPGLNVQVTTFNLQDDNIRYPVAISYNMPTKGMLGFGRIIDVKLGYRF